MNQENWITYNDCAKRCSCNRSTIVRRIKKLGSLANQFKRKEGNKTLLSTYLIDLDFDRDKIIAFNKAKSQHAPIAPDDAPIAPNDAPGDAPNDAPGDNSIVDFLKDQIDKKDDQIKALHDRLKETSLIVDRLVLQVEEYKQLSINNNYQYNILGDAPIALNDAPGDAPIAPDDALDDALDDAPIAPDDAPDDAPSDAPGDAPGDNINNQRRTAITIVILGFILIALIIVGIIYSLTLI